MSIPLRRLIQEGPLPASLALGYLDDILEELEVAHSRGGPSGRVAPESIVVVSHERAPLKARLVDDAAISAAYATPEQLEGQPATEASDIFSVGVVAYEMLTGRHPFGGSDDLPPSSVEHNILHEPPYPILISCSWTSLSTT